MDVTERLSFFATIFRVEENPSLGMWLLFGLIFILTAAVYRMAFTVSERLPILKSLIIYIVIGLACTIFTFLGIFLPVAEGLTITVILLALYKLRTRLQQKNDVNVN